VSREGGCREELTLPVSFPVPAGISKSGASPLAAVQSHVGKAVIGPLPRRSVVGPNGAVVQVSFRAGRGRAQLDEHARCGERPRRCEHGVNIVAVTDRGVAGRPVKPTWMTTSGEPVLGGGEEDAPMRRQAGAVRPDLAHGHAGPQEGKVLRNRTCNPLAAISATNSFCPSTVGT
jgi:hypothetical protein